MGDILQEEETGSHKPGFWWLCPAPASPGGPGVVGRGEPHLGSPAGLGARQPPAPTRGTQQDAATRGQVPKSSSPQGRPPPAPPLPNLGAHGSASPLFPASPGGFGCVAEPPRPHAAMGTRLSPATFASPGAPRAHPRGSPHSYRSPPRGPTAGHAWVGSRGRLCPSSPEPRLPGPAQGRAKSAQGLGEARAGPGPIFNPTEGAGSPVPRGT